MKYLIRLLTILILVAFAVPSFAAQEEAPANDPVINCYIKNEVGSINSVLKRMQNLGITFDDTDYKTLNEEETRGIFLDAHPRAKNGWYYTKYQTDAETGALWFTVEVPKSVTMGFPRNDNPHFSVQCDGERVDPDDPESPLLPHPTFKQKTSPPEGEVWDGTYYDEGVRIMQ
jgi:hypothetical protein